MGRKKVAMEYIKDAKARKATFERRKIGLKNKAYELSTLCDSPVCVVVFPEGSDSEPLIHPEDKAEAKSIMDRYVSVSRDEGFSEEGSSSKRRKINDSPPDLDGLTRDQLVELASALDYKIALVTARYNLGMSAIEQSQFPSSYYSDYFLS